MKIGLSTFQIRLTLLDLTGLEIVSTPNGFHHFLGEGSMDYWGSK